nr:hypothetical protein [Tanacetum cinerariifolium]
MADNRTMAELLQAPTEGYEDAIVIPEITANNFELRHGLINLVQNKHFFGHDKEDPQAHIRYFNKITSTMRVPNSKSKLRQSQAKAVVAKVSMSSSTPAISSEVSELKDIVRALLLDKKNQSSAPAQSSTPAPVKAIEPSCVTCGGTHSYQNCPATIGNDYRDNIQDQIRPPGFPPHQNHQNNFNRGNNFNQNRGGNFNQSNFNQGGNFNQGQLHRPHVNQPPAYQALAYQAPIPQTQSVTQTNFVSYIKANDTVLRNMQSQGQNVQNQCQGLQTQIANLTDMLSKFVSSNTASSSGSGTLPSNTVTNPKEDLKGITTRSGVAYQGPTIPTQSKVVKQRTEVTKDQVETPSSQSTTPVQPPVIQSETQTPVSEPVAAPVSVPIPYLSRCDNERRRDQANDQIEKFYKIFKEMSFEISFTDALILMPKFASTLKALIGNKEKLSEMARTLMNEHCNLGASINLMPLSVWKGLSLSEQTLTCMTLELADRSVSKPIGIGKDVSFKTGRALINVHKGELTLRIKNEAITYNLDQTMRDSDFLLFEEADAFLGLEDDPDSSKINPFYYDPEGDILLLEAILNSEPLPPLPNHKQYMPSYKKELKVGEAKTIKSSVDEPLEVELKDLPPHIEYAFLEGDNKLPIIITKRLGDEEKSALIKVLKSHKRAIAWKLSDIQCINPKFCTHKILMEEDYKPAMQHQRRVNPKIHDVIKKEVEKLLDARLIYPISDSPWVSPEKTTFTCPYGTFAYRRMPFCLFNAPGTFQRCEDTNLSLNWENSHFMVKEGIVLGHKISKNGIEVDKAKVDVIAKLPHPTTVKEKEMLAVVYAFKIIRSYLIMNKSIVHTDHFALKYLFAKKDAKARLLRWVLLLQEFDFKVLDTKGAENLAADHLSRLENPYENLLDPKEINETFPLETL